MTENPEVTEEQEVEEQAQTPEVAPDPEAPAEAAADVKEQRREGFATRKLQQEAEALRKELEGYKRREDEARKAKLTEQERLKEEADTLRQENERLKMERLQQKVAAEFKLPATLAARLQGTDEEALRADAADLAKLLPRPKVGTVTDPARDQGQALTYTRAQLQADPKLAQKVGQMLREGKAVVITG